MSDELPPLGPELEVLTAIAGALNVTLEDLALHPR